MKLTTKEKKATLLLGLGIGIGLAGALYGLNMIMPLNDSLAATVGGIPNLTAMLFVGAVTTYIFKNV